MPAAHRRPTPAASEAIPLGWAIRNADETMEIEQRRSSSCQVEWPCISQLSLSSVICLQFRLRTTEIAAVAYDNTSSSLYRTTEFLLPRAIRIVQKRDAAAAVARHRKLIAV